MPDDSGPSTRTTLNRVCRWLVPSWLYRCEPDPRHFHRRRFTSAYRRKRAKVKNIWIAWGVASVAYSQPPFVIMIGLVAIFSSFLVLDETG